ncbi:hypothetical protein Bpfe_006309 [Biomphalaria pfeifferi]|uniref:Uncharacterized protein n=1 Tax=Biomphalaria pfeifferi TaxID=112525 RepID=A0AAD8C086_BIOPF|nr:hypothetical protein Bpfe_006309 [Biomphalaria pfeifferi]
MIHDGLEVSTQCIADWRQTELIPRLNEIYILNKNIVGAIERLKEVNGEWLCGILDALILDTSIWLLNKDGGAEYTSKFRRKEMSHRT